MNDFDERLGARLAALEGQITAPAPPNLGRSRRARIALPFAAGPALAVLVFATAAAGAIVVSTLVRGYPGIQDPGQPLQGAQLECMTPPQAATFLSDRGFVDVVWQVESGDPNAGTTSATQTETPPTHGFVVPGSILGDGRLHMIVDQRVGATGVGACVGLPMP